MQPENLRNLEIALHSQNPEIVFQSRDCALYIVAWLKTAKKDSADNDSRLRNKEKALVQRETECIATIKRLQITENVLKKERGTATTKSLELNKEKTYLDDKEKEYQHFLCDLRAKELVVEESVRDIRNARDEESWCKAVCALLLITLLSCFVTCIKYYVESGDHQT